MTLLHWAAQPKKPFRTAFYGAQRAFYISWSEGRAQSGEREWKTRRGCLPAPVSTSKGSTGGLYTQIGTKYFFMYTLQSTFLPTYVMDEEIVLRPMYLRSFGHNIFRVAAADGPPKHWQRPQGSSRTNWSVSREGVSGDC